MTYDSSIKICPFDFEDDSLIDQTIFLLNLGSSNKKHNRLFWDWRFSQNPFGKSYGWYALDTATNSLAGVLLWWPWIFTVNKKEFIYYQAINGKVDSKYRNSGIFLRLNNVAISHFKKEDICLFGFPNENSYPSYNKLGWITLTVVHPVYIAISPFKSLIKLAFKKRNNIVETTGIEFPDFEINRANSYHNLITTAWTNQRFNWRFKNHPIHKYYYFSYKESLFVYKIKKRWLFSEAQIVFSDINNPEAFRSYTKHLVSKQVDLFSYFGYNTRLSNLLGNRVFKYKLKKKLYFVINDMSGFGNNPFSFEMAEADNQ